ncbi:MAG: pyridoxal phosphate-dependent aminotransferase [Myxococcota bacterium]
MPRAPHFAAATRAMPGAVFSPIAGRMADVPGGVCPLHVGDTWREPCVGARMEDLHEAELPGLHRYADTRGRPELVEAIVEKARARNRIPCDPEDVLVTAGATGALGASLGAIASPGDEVLVLAPFWPLIRGIVEAFRATPVEVPFFDRVHGASDAVAALREKTTSRTVALYVSTPSNPTGRVLPSDWLEAIAEWAASQGLWLLADEVYEDYVYRGEHVSIARFVPERTLSVFSFSKAYGMAGNRVGYLVGPAAAVAEARKISTHTFYAAPTAGQLAGLRALEGGDAWIAESRAAYQRIGDATAARLGVPAPQGATYHFVDVASRLDERGVWGFLEDCVGQGVALAPGPSCGQGYDTWVRLCYTAAPPEQVEDAVARVATLLGR